MKRHDRGGDRERGATALLVAMSMLLLMGIASLAVDLGLAFNERRQDQAAADVGSLAALQFAQPNPGCTGPSACTAQAVASGAAAAIDVASASLDDPSLADWGNASLCGTAPAGFTVAPASPCVAFNAGLTRAWVKIPTIASPTFFAKVFGGDQVNVSAYAIADQEYANPGPVLPFLLPGNAAAANYNCLKTGPNPSWGVCEDLPSVGNFGSMDFFLYGNADRNTTQKCSGDTNGRLLSNIARGVDHPLGIHPTGFGPGIEEPTNCPLLGAEPDMAMSQTGVGSALEDGLVYGGSTYSLDGSSYDGLLEDSSGLKVRNAGGGTPEVRLDDVALWSYLKGGLPSECTGVDTPGEMLDCIDWAKSTGTEIFDDSIVDSARFGFTPQVAELDFLSSGFYHIIGYRPVYVDASYYGCDSNGCNIVHTPEVADSGACPPAPESVTCGTAGSKNDALVAVTAYILTPDILPDVAKSPSPGSDGQRRFNLSE
ncbi:MAG: pilus assembly protein TadG-related protein [Acidimicrobiia bacterium]